MIQTAAQVATAVDHARGTFAAAVHPRRVQPRICWAPLSWPVVAVRTANDSQAIAAARREAVAEVDPRVPVYDGMTLEERLSAVVATPRLYAVVVGAAAAAALLLALFGIYGLLSRAVSMRGADRHPHGDGEQRGDTLRARRGRTANSRSA